MWYLLNCHDIYTRLKLYESQIGKESTYHEKESTCLLINWIFNANATPSDLNNDNNSLADKCIQLKSEFETFLSYHHLLGDNFSIDDVMSFINHIEYNNLRLKINHIQYPKALNIVIIYLNKQIDYNTFRNEMIKIHHSEFPFQCNLTFMVKSLQKAEIEFHDLINKRRVRLDFKNKSPVNQ